MSSTDGGELSFELFSFDFRDSGAITIPDSIRQIAYWLAVDLIIESDDGNTYLSTKSEPPKSFYGYASLVKSDCLLLPIPVEFPRQRIYESYTNGANDQWQNQFFYFQGYKKWLDFFANLLSAAGENEIPKPSVIVPEPYFILDTLTEVYFKASTSIQFRFEVSVWTPKPFTDDDGISYNGESGIPHTAKDSGLPSTGIQPKHNSPSTPFAGNPTPKGTTNSPDWSNDKEGNLDKVDPNNNPEDVPGTSTTTGFYFSLNAFFLSDDQGGAFTGVLNIGCTKEATLNVVYVGSETTLPHNNTTVQEASVSLTDGSFNQTVNLIAGSPVTGSLEYGLLPPSTASIKANQW